MFILAAIALASPPTVAVAIDTFVEIRPSDEAGGPGGGVFEETCSRGGALVGVNVTVGKDMNSISPVCAYTQNGTAWGNFYHMRTWGDARGQVGTGSCRPGVVVGMHVGVSSANLVHHVELICRDTSTGKIYERRLRHEGSSRELIHAGESQRTEWIYCGQYRIAVGLRGGYGSHVDRLGLVCGQFEHAPAQQQPTPFPEYTPPVSPPQEQPSRGGPLPVGGGGGGGGGANGRANSEVTAYAQKFGKGAEVDYLEPGEAVTIIQCGNPEDWCEISAPVYGWVYAPQLDR